MFFPGLYNFLTLSILWKKNIAEKKGDFPIFDAEIQIFLPFFFFFDNWVKLTLSHQLLRSQRLYIIPIGRIFIQNFTRYGPIEKKVPLKFGWHLESRDLCKGPTISHLTRRLDESTTKPFLHSSISLALIYKCHTHWWWYEFSEHL